MEKNHPLERDIDLGEKPVFAGEFGYRAPVIGRWRSLADYALRANPPYVV